MEVKKINKFYHFISYLRVYMDVDYPQKFRQTDSTIMAMSRFSVLFCFVFFLTMSAILSAVFILYTIGYICVYIVPYMEYHDVDEIIIKKHHYVYDGFMCISYVLPTLFVLFFIYIGIIIPMIHWLDALNKDQNDLEMGTKKYL